MSIISFDPATLLQIRVGDLSAPVAVGTELSKLYLSSDEIVRLLIQAVHIDEETKEPIIPPDLLPWFKEQRMILSEIYKLTGKVEQDIEMRRMELQGEIFKQLIKDLPPAKKIILIKALKNVDSGTT